MEEPQESARGDVGFFFGAVLTMGIHVKQCAAVDSFWLTNLEVGTKRHK